MANFTGGAIENAPEMVIYSKLKLTTEDRPEPLVSVLVPCFNSARFVRTFMSCLLMQSYRNMQVIVVDDGSKDDTYHRLMRYSESFAARRIELMVVRQRNKGAAAAINRALKYVKGEFILLYDSDDVLYRDAIWSKVAFLQDHPDFGMVRSNGYVTNSPFELGRNFFTLEKRQPGAILYDLVRGNAYNWPGSYMVRSGVLFEELGPDKDIYASRYGQNLQIMMPVAGASKCGFINRPQMNYFVHQDSDSSYGGLPRTIERAQGYACNRRAILHSIRISDEERKYLISLVDHDLARKMVDIARESKDKALYERYCGEVYGSAAKAHLKWAGTRIGVDRVWKFCVKVNSHVKRRWGSLLLERHLRALNDAGYDLY